METEHTFAAILKCSAVILIRPLIIWESCPLIIRDYSEDFRT